MKKKLTFTCVVFGIILVACSYTEALEHQSTGAAELIGKLNAIAEFVTSDNPLLQEIAQLVGGKPCLEGKDQPTCFDNDGYRVIYWLDAPGAFATTRRVQFTIPDINSGIVFKDIISVFGKWTMVGPESKISIVRFLYTNPKTKMTAIVFADLYDPPRNLESPVMGIVIQQIDPSTIDFK